MAKTTVREIMSSGVECAKENETIEQAAKKLADLNVGAMPICGEDDRLKGMITDRDIAVKIVAEGKDPKSTKVSEIAEGKPITIGADDSVEDALKTMSEHKVRRLPVIDGRELVGVISQADVARNLPDEKTGDLVGAISAG